MLRGLPPTHPPNNDNRIVEWYSSPAVHLFHVEVVKYYSMTGKTYDVEYMAGIYEFYIISEKAGEVDPGAADRWMWDVVLPEIRRGIEEARRRRRWLTLKGVMLALVLIAHLANSFA